MATNRTTFAQAQTSETSLSWSKATGQPARADGQDRHSVGISTTGARVWLWDDLLEKVRCANQNLVEKNEDLG